jgi:hypothetical protein
MALLAAWLHARMPLAARWSWRDSVWDSRGRARRWIYSIAHGQSTLERLDTTLVLAASDQRDIGKMHLRKECHTAAASEQRACTLAYV